MISIIISSYKPNLFEDIKLNIEQTIGVEFELIKIDNPGIYSMTEAYNLGAGRAIYDILCFVHEDVKFHTTDWGKKVLNHFNVDKDLGLIGVAGSTEKLRIPVGWGHHVKEKNKIHIIHEDHQGELMTLSSYEGKNHEYVKVLDGVLLIAKKSVWESVPFDERIKGFHLYDLDFSLRVAQHYKVAVTYDILIQHFSHGNYSEDWLNATIAYHKNPQKADLFNSLKNDEKIVRRNYYIFMMKSNLTLKSKLTYLFELGIDMRSLPAIFLFFFPKLGSFMVVNVRNRIAPKKKSD